MKEKLYEMFKDYPDGKYIFDRYLNILKETYIVTEDIHDLTVFCQDPERYDFAYVLRITCSEGGIPAFSSANFPIKSIPDLEGIPACYLLY